jgi:glycosyltransferase involved in cell wall biosynthesis
MNYFIPNISIIIPTYKRNKYLLKIIQNLNHQIFFNQSFEIIVVDSCKNNLFKELKLKNTRYFNIIENSNALKRNIGLKKARSKNIIFLDDDCIPSKNFLIDYYNIFKSLKTNIIICGSVKYDLNDIKKNKYLSLRADNHIVVKKNNFIERKILPPSHIVTMNMGFKLNTFFKPFFRKEFKNYGFEDYEFGFRYINSGYKIIASHPLVIHKDNRSYIYYINKFYFLGNRASNIFSQVNFLAYQSTRYYNLENILLIFRNNKIFIYIINMLYKFNIFLFKFRLFQNKYLLKFTIIIAFTMGILDRFNNKNRQLVWY